MIYIRMIYTPKPASDCCYTGICALGAHYDEFILLLIAVMACIILYRAL